MCACGGIVNAVIAWSNHLWGYYFGTGFWSGAVMLLAGMFGIVASYVRSICAVKTFLIISIFGCISSLGMIALASGGLDSRSGFYHGYNKTTFMTSVIHAVYLGLGVLQLSLGVLSDGICIYYLFIGRSAELYCVKDGSEAKHGKKNSNIRRNGKERSSTGSQVPLVSESRQSKRCSVEKDTISNRRSQSIGENEIFPIPYTASGNLNRQALLRQELLMTKITPSKTPCTRSASFSTFGRISRPDRESLIVHPTDDNASVADTVNTNPPRSPDDECHYAQTMLFGPPVPIEHDEILPPYEIVDRNVVRSKPKRRGLKRPKSEELHISRNSRGRNSSSEREKRGSGKKSKNSSVKSKIPPVTKETQSEHGSLRKRLPKEESSTFNKNMVRLSRSADLLSFDDEIENKRTCYDSTDSHGQGTASRKLSNSSDMILVMDQPVLLRHKRPQSQTVRVNRDRQLERRRKALSAEYKPNKNQNMFHERIGLEHRSDSIDGSNSSLYAGNRIIPTKFSLRQPVRQIGMPHVCSPVPVKPLVHVPKVGPPPKPPRNFSVKAEDLKDLDMDKEVDTIFADIDGLNGADNIDDVFDANDFSNAIEDGPLLVTQRKPVDVAVHNLPKDRVLQSDESVTVNASVVPLSPEVKLDSGPVLKFVPPNREVNQNIDKNKDVNKTVDKSEIIDIKKEVYPGRQSTDTMILPSSPIMRPPNVLNSKKTGNLVNTQNATENISKDNIKEQLKFSFENDNNNKNTEVVYAKVIKDKPTSPVSPVSPVSSTSPTSPSSKVLKAKRLTYSFKDRDVSVFDPIGNSKEIEETIEVTDSISVQYPVEKTKESDVVCKPYGQPIIQSNTGRIESQPTVILRQPLSPSQRILQRKANTVQKQKDLSPTKDNRPVIIQPTNTFIIDLTNTDSGARPKTSNNGFSSNFISPQQFHVSRADTKETKRPVSNPVGSFRESPQKDVMRRQMSQSAPSKSALPPILPKPQKVRSSINNKQTSGVSDNSAKFVPAVTTATVSTTWTVAGAPAGAQGNPNQFQNQSSNSQGVLHLPQSQLSRQVSDTVRPPMQEVGGQQDMAAAAAAVQNVNMRQNNARQNDDDQTDKPLFSMVL